MSTTYRITGGVIQGTIDVSATGIVIRADRSLDHLWGRLFSNVEAWAKANGAKVEPCSTTPAIR